LEHKRIGVYAVLLFRIVESEVVVLKRGGYFTEFDRLLLLLHTQLVSG